MSFRNLCEAVGKLLAGVIIGFAITFFFATALFGQMPRTIAEVRPASEVTLPIDPPDVYRKWWAATELCMGLYGDFSRWKWYSVNEDAFTVTGLGNMLFTAYTFGPNDPVVKPAYYWRIYVVNGHLLQAMTIRHEMVHALADMNGIVDLHNSPSGDSLFAVFAKRDYCRPT